MPPPTRPRYSTGEWEPIERELGTALPDDYKHFITAYGQGKICNSLWVDNYLALAAGETARGVIDTYLAQYKDVKEIGVSIPYSLFPDPKGLLPFGGLENGGAINWRRSGSPNDWDIVVWDSESDAFFPADGLGLVAFLVELVSRRWEHFSSRFDPEAFAVPRFVPFD
jgi:hypothetical protein